ncbi:MAG: ABC transporter ATP-binding protein [Pirellulaceae bacterium]
MSNPARQVQAVSANEMSGVNSADDQPRDRLRVTQPTALTAVDVYKSYQTGNVEVPVLRGVDIAIAEGEFAAIVGQSGSGKSTLLHLLGTLDNPDKGEIWIGQDCVNTMKPLQRDRLRNQDIGLIFQFYHLLPELTALENVMVPRMIGNGFMAYLRHRRQFEKRARSLLEKVGLGHRLHHRPNQMSGGEMQRAAIARALITRPQLLLADEPTGNLDRQNGEEVIRVLMTLCEEESLTVVMVTHDDEIAQTANRIIRLSEGRVVAETPGQIGR